MMLKFALAGAAGLVAATGSPVAAQSLPADQVAFIKVVEEAKSGIRTNAPTSTQESMLDWRGHQLCKKVKSPAVVDWLGTVWHLGTMESGNPTIAFMIGTVRFRG